MGRPLRRRSSSSSSSIGEVEVPELCRHGVGAVVAVLAEVVERVEEVGRLVVQPVAEDVEVLVVAVQGGELGRGDELDVVVDCRFRCFLDPADGVVVGQGEQLDARVRGRLHDLRRRQ